MYSCFGYTYVCMYEHRTHPLLPRRKFMRRVAFHGLAAAAFVSVSLTLGIIGYHFVAGLSWIDALLNASMILTGMGPVDVLRSDTAKLFASFSALSPGVVFLVTASILVAPIAHRLLPRLHLGGQEDDGVGGVGWGSGRPRLAARRP